MLPAARELLQAPPRQQPVGARHKAADVPAAGPPLPGHRESTGLTAGQQAEAQSLPADQAEVRAPRARKQPCKSISAAVHTETQQAAHLAPPSCRGAAVQACASGCRRGRCGGRVPEWERLRLAAHSNARRWTASRAAPRSHAPAEQKGLGLPLMGLPLPDCVLARDEEGTPSLSFFGIDSVPPLLHADQPAGTPLVGEPGTSTSCFVEHSCIRLACTTGSEQSAGLPQSCICMPAASDKPEQHSSLQTLHASSATLLATTSEVSASAQSSTLHSLALPLVHSGQQLTPTVLCGVISTSPPGLPGMLPLTTIALSSMSTINTCAADACM